MKSQRLSIKSHRKTRGTIRALLWTGLLLSFVSVVNSQEINSEVPLENNNIEQVPVENIVENTPIENNQKNDPDASETILPEETETLPETTETPPETGDKPVSNLENALSPEDNPSTETTNTPADRFALAQELLFTGKHEMQTEAFKILTDLSTKHGLPNAQHALSFMLTNGIGAEQNIPKGLTFKTFAALGGDEGARLSLGFQYYTGSGVSKDCEKALVYYEQVAHEVIERYKTGGLTTLSNRHNTDLQKYQIKLYEYNDPSIETAADASQEEEALDWIKFRQAKSITDPDQLLVIGQYYMNGMFGLPRDFKKAILSFEKVRQANGKEHPLALAYLGKIYLEGGDGIEKNFVKAFDYLNRAINMGSAVARATMGYAHLHGLGDLEVNEEKAQKFFEDSAKSGWFEGAVHLGEMYYDGRVAGGKTLKNYQNALKYFGIASQQRNIVAMFYMGKMHMNGLGASRNCQTATGYFKEVIEMGDKETIQLWKHAFTSYEAGNKASALMYYLWLADLGYEIAQVNAAQMIQEERNSGILTKEEVEVAKNENNGGFVRAKYNLQRAADQSNLCASFATLHLGDYYYIYEQNYDKAISLYRSSGDSHSNPQALFNIGYMYQYGQGLTKDLHLAKRYYDKAQEADQDAAIPVFLALAKLCIDSAIIKAEKLFTKDNLEKWSPMSFDFEGSLVKLFGGHWDVIAITILAFILAFVMAWRRQNALVYRRLRATELMRLQEMQGVEDKKAADKLAEEMERKTAETTETTEETTGETTGLLEENKSDTVLEKIESEDTQTQQNSMGETND